MDQARYEARLRLIGCVVCIALGQPVRPCAELHHLGDPNTGERNEKAKVPLCWEHHQGPEGIHAMRRRIFVQTTELSDVRLLTITLAEFVKDLP